MRVCRDCLATYDDDHQFCPVDGSALRSLTPLPDDQLGTTLAGEFHLTAIAGRGMGGVVYKAWQDRMERNVAVKILHRPLVRDRSMVRRFHREARAVARLSHPNIVNVFTSGTTDYDAPYLVMEHIEGDRLDEVVDAGVLDEQRAVAIARQIVSALADTHAEGIVHRDLKPANIFLVQHRRTPDFVKILDFGIAKLMAAAGRAPGGDVSRLTHEGAVCGTPHYIAPEQASGQRIDHRADLYSVGVMLYQMVTGRVPFEGSGMAVLLAHVNKPVPPPRTFRPEVSPGLEAIIMRCLAKGAGERYQSAEALADALDLHVEVKRAGSIAGAPTMAATRQLPTRSSSQLGIATDDVAIAGAAASLVEPPVRRRWTTAFASIAVIGLLAFGGVTMGPGYLPTSFAATPAAPLSSAAAASPRAFSPTAQAPVARRALVVSDGQYSLRVIVPQRLLVDMHHEVSLDLWDAAGEPLSISEVIVTLSREGGGSKGLAAKPTDKPGRYRFHRLLKHPGEYTLSVYPPGADDAIQVFFEVLKPGHAAADQS